MKGSSWRLGIVVSPFCLQTQIFPRRCSTRGLLHSRYSTYIVRGCIPLNLETWIQHGKSTFVEDALNAASRCKFCTLKGRSKKFPGCHSRRLHVSAFRPATCTSIRQSKMSQPQSWVKDNWSYLHRNTRPTSLFLHFGNTQLGRYWTIPAHKQSIQTLSSPSEAIHTHAKKNDYWL